MDAVEAILARRSIGRLVEPAPGEEDLRTILRAAAAAPDHGELRPFRFTLIRSTAMDAFGAVLEAAYLARCEEGGVGSVSAKAEKERGKLRRAPLVLVVSAVRRVSGKVPWEEQRDAAAAAAQNALVAATALGYGSMWRSGEITADPRVKATLGLDEGDAVLGFLYLGTTPGDGAKPPRSPDLDGLVFDWDAP